MVGQFWRAEEVVVYIPGAIVLTYGSIIAFLFICFFTNNFIAHPAYSSSPATLHLDRMYTSPYAVDLVISIYREPQNDVQRLIRSLVAVPDMNISQVYVYTKDPFTDLTRMKLAIGADHVEHLPNVGREGHTYLHHIIHHWDDLAAHTVFLPGNLHDEGNALKRIEDYFTPNRTGFLDLGPEVGTTCSCSSCGDRFGWADPIAIQHVHKDFWPDVRCKNILVTFKSQFIASSKRMRGVKKSWWQQLKADMEDKMSWMHQPEYVQDKRNTLNAPWFGYALERMWGMLMQCNDMEIAWKCSSLQSRKRLGGDLKDCQCLDEE